MEGEALLIGIGSFGVGIAGFSAVAASLRSDSAQWTAAHSFRLRGLVSTSLLVAFESVLPLIAASALADTRAALLIASLIAATFSMSFVSLRTRQGLISGGIRLAAVRFMLVAGWMAVILYFLNAVAYQSVAVYALALWVQLAIAAVSFYSLIATAP